MQPMIHYLMLSNFKVLESKSSFQQGLTLSFVSYKTLRTFSKMCFCTLQLFPKAHYTLTSKGTKCKHLNRLNQPNQTAIRTILTRVTQASNISGSLSLTIYHKTWISTAWISVWQQVVHLITTHWCSWCTQSLYSL